MNIKNSLFIILLIFSSQNIYAKKEAQTLFLLKATDETSFMNYEFHNLAYEAAQNRHYEDAYRIYLKLANKGDSRAEYNIGMMYMKGLGVERKKMDAYKWLRRASRHGNKEAILYFKEMTDRYDTKAPTHVSKPKEIKKTILKKAEKPKEVVNSIPFSIVQSPEPLKKIEKVQKTEEAPQESFSLSYLLISSLGLILILGLFFKKSKSAEKKPDKDAHKLPKHKSQMYQSTYANILDYHTELLKQINLPQLKADKTNMQIYYMFLYGVIDYFCQLEKFTDTEQRRIFTTHTGEQEGQENLTAITQSILEGQRDHSMYHYQAAGGISAKAWHEDNLKDALGMLKKLILEKNG